MNSVYVFPICGPLPRSPTSIFVVPVRARLPLTAIWSFPEAAFSESLNRAAVPVPPLIVRLLLNCRIPAAELEPGVRREPTAATTLPLMLAVPGVAPPPLTPPTVNVASPEVSVPLLGSTMVGVPVRFTPAAMLIVVAAIDDAFETVPALKLIAVSGPAAVPMACPCMLSVPLLSVTFPALPPVKMSPPIVTVPPLMFKLPLIVAVTVESL